jgi:hypothetical protein
MGGRRIRADDLPSARRDCGQATEEWWRVSEQEQSVDEILSELDTMIEGSQDIASEQRERLSGAVAQIREALEHGEHASEPGSLMDRLREALEGWEDRHPRLTAMVGRVADSLSDLGI